MTTPQPSLLPLKGVKVLDFGQYIAGPAVAMILADLGATVIHVDPPNGPMWQSPANATLNRNKTIVTIDLKTPEGLEEALELISEVDIVVESFRPGVIKRLGIDFAAGGNRTGFDRSAAVDLDCRIIARQRGDAACR